MKSLIKLQQNQELFLRTDVDEKELKFGTIIMTLNLLIVRKKPAY